MEGAHVNLTRTLSFCKERPLLSNLSWAAHITRKTFLDISCLLRSFAKPNSSNTMIHKQLWNSATGKEGYYFLFLLVYRNKAHGAARMLAATIQVTSAICLISESPIPRGPADQDSSLSSLTAAGLQADQSPQGRVGCVPHKSAAIQNANALEAAVSVS